MSESKGEAIKAKGDELIDGYMKVFARFNITHQQATERAINYVSKKAQSHWKKAPYWNEVLNYLKSKL